ncbi:invasion associated locus B family protein, partial [Mesorhizobium sp. M7A.F.Ca.US.005.03.2.1]
MNYWLSRNSRFSRNWAKVIFFAALSGIGLSAIVSGTANAAQPSGTVRSTHGAW